MSQVDEGLIHAWLDGQLSPDDAARVDKLIATDASWGAAAANARGVTAGASRILGALDDVPSVRGVGGGATGLRTKRSLWREPWLRAAAAVVLAVGLGSYVMRQLPADDTLIATKEVQQTLDAAGRTQSVQNSTAAPGVASVPPAPVEARPTAVAERAREMAKRDEGAASKTAPRLDSARGGAVALGSVAGAGAASDAGARANAATTRPIVVGDSGKVSALALQKPAVAPINAAVGATSAVGPMGGRGGRAASSVAAETRDLTSTAAKSFAEPSIIDPRLSGCWLTIDTVPSRVYVLKFIDPIATDVHRAASAPPAAQSSGARQAPASALPRVPAGARVENTSPRKFGTDSSFSAEWITGNGRTTLIFAVHGDTLDGNTILATGDIRYPRVPLRAARVQCPQ